MDNMERQESASPYCFSLIFIMNLVFSMQYLILPQVQTTSQMEY